MSAVELPLLPIWAATLLATLLLAVWGAIPRGRSRPVRAKSLARALLPRRMLRSRSGRLDVAAFLFAMLVAGAALGWALVSADWWAGAVSARLGPPAGAPLLPAWLGVPIVTLGLFLAYELAYWLNHWMSHRIGWLWAFHRVHHSAESLSLLTNFRVHPVDTILFYNMAACITGITGGMLGHFLGSPAQLAVGGANLLVFTSSILLSYLQHSHLWLSLPGRLGRVVMSPSHHQLHHSTDPRHHDRNFGSTLALFDWAFGSLLMPTRERQALRFGVEGIGHDPHGPVGAVLLPFADAARALVPERGASSRPPAPIGAKGG